MGKNNRQRRAAKNRKHAAKGGRRPGPAGGHAGGPTWDLPPIGPSELFFTAVHAHRNGDAEIAAAVVGRLASLPRRSLAETVQEMLDTQVSHLWNGGWQPADLEASGYEALGARVAPEWMGQLEAVGATRWWEQVRKVRLPEAREHRSRPVREPRAHRERVAGANSTSDGATPCSRPSLESRWWTAKGKYYVRDHSHHPVHGCISDAEAKSGVHEICSAIAHHRLVALVYGDQERLIEPYEHGYTSEGVEVLLCYQRDGGSRSLQTEGWKTLVAARIAQPEVLDVTFVSKRLDYNPRSPDIATFHCLVED